MLICLACYEQRLATLFDNAKKLSFYKQVNNDLKCIEEMNFESADLLGRIRALKDMHAEILLCGGISSQALRHLKRVNIKVVPWIKGTCEEVLKAWTNGGLEKQLMPGCKSNKMCRRKRCSHGEATNLAQVIGHLIH